MSNSGANNFKRGNNNLSQYPAQSSTHIEYELDHQGRPVQVTVETNLQWSSGHPIPPLPFYSYMYMGWQQCPHPHAGFGEWCEICYPSVPPFSMPVPGVQITPIDMDTDNGGENSKTINGRLSSSSPLQPSSSHPSRKKLVSINDSIPRSRYHPTMSVSGIQGPYLQVTVVCCKTSKNNEVHSWQHLYVVLKYGGKTYKKDSSKENFEIKLTDGVTEMDIFVSKSNSQGFIGTGKIELRTVLSQGLDTSVWPLKSSTNSGSYAGEVTLVMQCPKATLYNSPPMIVDDGPAKVEESIRTKGSSHRSKSNAGSRNNLEWVEKLNDLNISKEEDNVSCKSSGGFLSELERSTPKQFSQNELKKFTSGFSNKVGSGGFGDVYKGQHDGTDVAVKVLAQNHLIEQTFKAEVSAMFKTCHRNLVKCYGYCYNHNMKALVYEYMENGSLDAILYGNPRNLEWQKFYKIAIETAKGISYLHDGCDDQIIHHDLKPANVLLDINLSAKITDFGLARLIGKDVTHATLTNIRGTIGYLAPEILTPFSEITSKCDIYSFGMMLFEVLRMQRNSDDSKWFPRHVWLKFDSGKLDEIIDDCGIHKKQDRANAKILCMVALWCIQFTPQTRPTIGVVLMMLEGELPVQKPPNPLLPSSMEPPQKSMTSKVIPSRFSEKRYNYY